MDQPGPRGAAQGPPLKQDPAASWPVSQVGRLGAPLLHHQFPHHRDPRRWAQRQARFDHRNLGPRESPRTPQDGE